MTLKIPHHSPCGGESETDSVTLLLQCGIGQAVSLSHLLGERPASKLNALAGGGIYGTYRG